ncbi:IS111A/IS1328/IS1533, transposase, partial [Pseudomonas putida S11]
MVSTFRKRLWMWAFFLKVFPQFQVRNDSEGFAQLIACLNELEVERVLLEATG